MAKASQSPLQGPKAMSVWWPLGFLIAWLVFAVVGGGLLGGGIASANANSCSFVGADTGCVESSGSNGILVGAIICLVISGLLGLAFWIVFIVWLVKRTRARNYTIHLGSDGYITPPNGGSNGQTYSALSPYQQQQQQPPPQQQHQHQQQPPMATNFSTPSPPQYAQPKQEPVEAPTRYSGGFAEASAENYR